MVFREENEKMHILSRYWVIFPSTFPTFWEISDVSFSYKSMKFAGVLILWQKIKWRFPFFYKAIKFSRIKASKWTYKTILGQNDLESNTWEKAHRLKLKYYYIYRKMEDVIRHIFTSVVMPLNFIHFRPKVGFQIALWSFTQLMFENNFKRTDVYLFSWVSKHSRISLHVHPNMTFCSPKSF